MKILIIEDEQPAAEQLKRLLASLNTEINVLEVLDSNASLLDWFETSSEIPDLIVSDIELLDGPVFNSLSDINPSIPIIFTTAYHEYTMKAFETAGIAYLLKPIEPESLKRALEKFKSFTKFDSLADIKSIINQLSTSFIGDYKKRFSVKVGQGIYLLKTKDINCLTMKNGVLHAYNDTGKSFILSRNLNEVSEQLDPSVFHLINRSTIVNINYIDKIETYGNERVAVFIKGHQEPFVTSAARTPSFRKWIEK